MVLFSLICCFTIPNVKGIDRIEQTFFWLNSYSNSDTIVVDKVLEDEYISWSFRTYDEAFEVSVVVRSPSGSSTWLCNSKTKDSGSKKLYISGSYDFTFLKEESVEGYITIVIENYTPPDLLVPMAIGFLVILGIIITVGIGRFIMQKNRSRTIRTELKAKTYTPYSTSTTVCVKCGKNVESGDFCSNCGEKAK